VIKDSRQLAGAIFEAVDGAAEPEQEAGCWVGLGADHGIELPLVVVGDGLDGLQGPAEELTGSKIIH
jgi:hypothetical protein